MKKFIYILSLIILTTYGCSNDIINKNPISEVSPENLFQTEGGFRRALDGVYAIMKEDLLGYNLGIYSIAEGINDDIVAGDPYGFTYDNSHMDIYPLSYDATAFQLEGFWAISYQAINNANAIIKAARTSELDNKNVFLAEALGLRAMLHYNLYRFFAPAYNKDPNAMAIPYRLETETLLSKKNRNTNEETINFILKDLLEAKDIATNNVNSYRISKTAIEALLARVYHETNNFESAIIYAEKALNNGTYTLENTATELSKEWQEDESNEIIFRIRFEAADNASNATLLAIPIFESYPYYVSDDLINLYDKAKDIRFDIYFELEPYGSGKFYPKKQAGIRTASPSTYEPGAIDIKLIRVPELYLILAESYYKSQKPDPSKALNYLNKLLKSRGLENYTGSNLSNEISNERRRELAFEGFRFTDLKRLGLGFTRSDGTSLAPNDNRFALPIPQLEVDRASLKQNIGY